MAGEFSLTGKGVNQTSLTTEPRHFEENWLNVKYKPEGYIPDDDDVDNVDDDVDDEQTHCYAVTVRRIGIRFALHQLHDDYVMMII